MCFFFFFFFNDTATTEIYTLSLHDAFRSDHVDALRAVARARDPAHEDPFGAVVLQQEDRKSTRLNSSHSQISYAVFCLKKKKTLSACASYRIPYHDTAATTTHTLDTSILR